MDVSIIILNYKAGGLVKYCVKGIKNAGLGLAHEIVVVDNNSDDNIKQIVQSFNPEVKLIEAEQNRGYAAGNNLGIKNSKGKYVLILNPDIAVFPGAMEIMVDFLEENPNAALVAPQLVNPDRTVQDSCYRFPDLKIPVYRRTALGRLPKAKKELAHYLMKDFDHQSPRRVDWVLGACLLLRREAIERVGPMDERYFLYFEDTDWCRRFWQAGYEVWYLPQAKMVHYHQRLSAELEGWRSLFNPHFWIHLASGVKYFRKWHHTKNF